MKITLPIFNHFLSLELTTKETKPHYLYRENWFIGPYASDPLVINNITEGDLASILELLKDFYRDSYNAVYRKKSGILIIRLEKKEAFLKYLEYIQKHV